MKGLKSKDFNYLLKAWESQYGSLAVPELVSFASQKRNEDHERYVAILAAARLGGKAIGPVLARFLNDGSWMIRSAGIKAIAITEPPETPSLLEKRLKDPALVVRIETVQTLQKLRLKESIPALISAAQDDQNYVNGRPLWIPVRALEAIMDLGADKTHAKSLTGVLKKSKDPEFIKKTIDVLERLTGYRTDAKAPLKVQVQYWEKILSAI